LQEILLRTLAQDYLPHIAGAAERAALAVRVVVLTAEHLCSNLAPNSLAAAARLLRASAQLAPHAPLGIAIPLAPRGIAPTVAPLSIATPAAHLGISTPAAPLGISTPAAPRVNPEVPALGIEALGPPVDVPPLGMEALAQGSIASFATFGRRERLAGDKEDASSMVTAGATASTTEGNSRASRESGLLCSHSHGESIDPSCWLLRALAAAADSFVSRLPEIEPAVAAVATADRPRKEPPSGIGGAGRAPSGIGGAGRAPSGISGAGEVSSGISGAGQVPSGIGGAGQAGGGRCVNAAGREGAARTTIPEGEIQTGIPEGSTGVRSVICAKHGDTTRGDGRHTDHRSNAGRPGQGRNEPGEVCNRAGHTGQAYAGAGSVRGDPSHVGSRAGGDYIRFAGVALFCLRALPAQVRCYMYI